MIKPILIWTCRSTHIIIFMLVTVITDSLQLVSSPLLLSARGLKTVMELVMQTRNVLDTWRHAKSRTQYQWIAVDSCVRCTLDSVATTCISQNISINYSWQNNLSLMAQEFVSTECAHREILYQTSIVKCLA